MEQIEATQKPREAARLRRVTRPRRYPRHPRPFFASPFIPSDRINRFRLTHSRRNLLYIAYTKPRCVKNACQSPRRKGTAWVHAADPVGTHAISRDAAGGACGRTARPSPPANPQSAGCAFPPASARSRRTRPRGRVSRRRAAGSCSTEPSKSCPSHGASTAYGGSLTARR